MAKRVAHLLVDALVEAGVQRVYGVRGNSLNGITDSIRIKKNIDWVHVRLEEVGAIAAGAEAHLTGTESGFQRRGDEVIDLGRAKVFR